MKQLLYGLSLTALLVMTTIVTLPETASAQTNRQCSAAISRAKAKIRAIRNVRILKVENNDISEEYNDFPLNRPRKYCFLIGGEGAGNITTSTKFLTAISQNIINHCQSVSLVAFSGDGTEEYVPFGLMPNGKVKPFECAYPSSGTGKVNWGYTNCNV